MPMSSLLVRAPSSTRASCHQKATRAEGMNSILTLGSRRCKTGWGRSPCSANTVRFAFQEDGESAGAAFPYQASSTFAMANPPMPTAMPIGGRSQSV
jgi:hypothetical protein